MVPLPREALLAVGLYLTVVGLVSTVGNSMFILVLKRRLRAVNCGQTVLLLNAAVCDLSIALTGYPYSIVSAFYGSWFFGDVLCRIYGFLCFTLNEVQMNSLVMIAVFRFVSVCRPQFKHLLTPGFAVRCLVGVWCYCLVWTAAPLLGWSRYVLEPAGFSCSTDWHDRTPQGIAYSFCLVVFCFVVQLVVLVVCYSSIWRRTGALQLRPPQTNPKLLLHRPDRDDMNLPRDVRCCRYYVCLCESTFRSGIEKHVLWVNIMMVLSFTILWTPYTLISIISVFKTDLSTFWYIFPTVFAKTSCMMNPLIYCLSHKLLYRELCVLLRACCCRFCRRDEVLQDLEDVRRQLDDETYDKEGIYLGKVKVALCTCNGCAMTRREMIVLARLQRNDNHNTPHNPTTTTTTQHHRCDLALVEGHVDPHEQTTPQNYSNTIDNSISSSGERVVEEEEEEEEESSYKHQQQQQQQQQ